ncbi:hopanoid biosynthesis associated radical SAM protein HpnH [Rhodothalassium salexigens DSM 2132]|uniref:Hopanoid biosynthesis associated radical SAM protein HpnH n=1 Tax=Rhodothalassium salexigens DSM 2132 TaxID=1188247 RepID=A0A4R2PDS9_RHOSA|nr:adenosyl-hopene transferase HpnH [Rhodothalassium salexigens]MBK1639042.1 hopanoid biosynthesis associated radical SAM protein HpnH [Rhodothalassium salexigens DSM 2132]TCP32594.1 hopanoid biosynthesis associated radical SAM protein HpnH [Rhodothalassium salexigens DSM 2132]
MAVPLIQQFRVGSYILKQKLMGRQRYPLVLMLEPLFQCNLACPGCGKIDYPKRILEQRLSKEECLEAVDECGAPMVSIPGGEPLLHKEIDEIVAEIVARKKFVYLCTNALLLKKALKKGTFKPSPYLTFSVHLDGLEEEHDEAVDMKGGFKRAVEAIEMAVEQGFRVTVNATLFNNAEPERVAEFFDYCMTLGAEGITVSPGYAYERAPEQEHFLNRQQTKTIFRDVFRLGKKRERKWVFNQSSLYLDFLAGNQQYECTPWGNPTRNVFGWQKPCYLLGEGYAGSFKELMEDTDWDSYGTGKYEKCANCMVHCGYEPTAVDDTVAHPFKAFLRMVRGVETEKPMVQDLDLSNQRPAKYIFDKQVDAFMNDAHMPDATKRDGEGESAESRVA